MDIEEYKEKLKSSKNQFIIEQLENNEIFNGSGKEQFKNTLYGIEKKKEKINTLLEIYEQIVSKSNEVKEYKKELEELEITLSTLNSDDTNRINEVEEEINLLKNKINELEEEMKTMADNC